MVTNKPIFFLLLLLLLVASFFILIILCNLCIKIHRRNIEIKKNYEKSKLIDDYIENLTKIVSNDAYCSICLSNFGDAEGIILECQHNFHKECFKKWYLKSLNKNCPSCRQDVIISVV